jgi:AcrR family transcriptional regulator
LIAEGNFKTMADQPRRPKKLRADAERNRELLLRAASEIFDDEGAEASLEAVARHAGVGIGTLYRHFPTREALLDGVYRREVRLLVDLAEQLRDAPSPRGAVRHWVRALVGFVAVKRSVSVGLAVVAQRRSTLAAGMMEEMVQALAPLLQGAVARGDIRSDVGAEEILRALLGICHMQDPLDWRRDALDRMSLRRRMDDLGDSPLTLATEH